ncbi:MAG: heavy metal translocating P-type ATPase [Anaerolineales bacterium]
MAEAEIRDNPTVGRKLQLEASSLVPGMLECQGICLERLAETLNGNKNVQLAHIKQGQEPALLCLHYDPSRLSDAQMRQIANRAGSRIASRYRHEVFPIEGMDCSDCALVIEHGLERMEGIFGAQVNYGAETLRVEYDSLQVSRLAIRRRVKQLGYQIPASWAVRWYKANRELLFSLLSGLALIAGWLGELTGSFPSEVSLGLYLAAYISGGWQVMLHTLHSLRRRSFDVDLLMLLAALGAAFIGQFAEGALLLFLFSLGHALEERALDRARRSIHSLADLAPRYAVVRQKGLELPLPVDQVGVGDLVVIRPGERFPVDGTVSSGSSAVNQSPVTGESMPVEKLPGEKVYAGSVNGEGVLEVQVTRLAKDSTLARITRMVEQAQAQKSPTQQMTERFMGWYVPAVLVIDLLLIAIPPLLGVPFSTSFIRAMTFLVAASPCALALGTPAALLAGIARAAHNGVLLKGGVHLENLGRLQAVAFDKTGTLTRGELAVTDILTNPAGGDTDALLALAASVERRSAHPLAKAVVRAAQERGLALPEAVQVKSVNGRGMQAVLGGDPLWLGSQGWFEANDMPIPASLRAAAEQLEEQGRTTILLRRDGSFAGLIALADVVRPDAPRAVAALREQGIKDIVMLSGDNQRAAAQIASQVGLSDYRAGLLPQEKLAAVQDLAKQYRVVAMVGDGVNDAPALANATVGIAMGGAGSDTALETADVALMSSDLDKLPFAVGLGRATRKNITQNLAIAMSVIFLLSASTIFGWVGIGLAVLFHEGSTLLVVLNGLRLLRYR